jgi:hypothetical protein
MRFLESGLVGAGLDMDAERGERVHITEAAQPGDRRPPLLVDRKPRDPLGKGLFAGGEPVDCCEQIDVRRSLIGSVSDGDGDG